MPDEEIKAVTEQQLGTAATETTTTEPIESKEPRPGTKEYNFRQLEKEKKEIERRLQEQEQRNREMQQALMQGLTGSRQPEKKEEELPALNPDDIPEWRHVTNVAEKIAEKKFFELQKKKELEELPKRVKAKFADYDEIVTADNVKELETTNPELANAISRADDPWTATYSVLKVLKGKPKADPVALEEAQKIQENEKKPNSINAVSKQGALKNANAFAKKSKEQLYKEMMEFAHKGA